MAAGHIMRAGSDGLTVTGGPFHVGDSIPLAILVHNGGDFAGSASLKSAKAMQRAQKHLMHGLE